MNATNQHAVRLIHIPKTAGTTVASGLLRKFGRRHKYVIGSRGIAEIQRFNHESSGGRKKPLIFLGHAPFHTGIPEADAATKITFLRDPVDRVCSFIQHAAAGKSAYLDITPNKYFDIDQFLISGNLELSNLQTKFLVNDNRPDTEEVIRRLGADHAVDLAVSRLANGIAAFGISEEFDAGWVAVWTALGRKAPIYAQLNQRPCSEKLKMSVAQIEKIRNLNQLDLRVYSAAKELFMSRLNSGEINSDSIEEFKRRQDMWSPVFSRFWQLGRRIYHKTLGSNGNGTHGGE